ncbi:hypothetical protein PFICI_01783 [Pestalotiopsis fici W106-1]|uniref:Something about silencing protein 4 domain-containing protein n=1 Tax=Pestalotiopsis fici (strain W106-1 / CGMCC3.15140) TaxID=1229662 RepID=W3XPR0_PESFW|nr:uncharacterized protein PFICI_01783 [Pestalotiopsis fici W106-1]ETS87955.1 hypothetical protein PFICI_01783 [Pestalotiopsis fici W106-1]
MAKKKRSRESRKQESKSDGDASKSTYIKQEPTPNGKSEEGENSKVAKNAPAKPKKGKKKSHEKLPALLQEVDNRCHNMIVYRNHLDEKVARLAECEDSDGLQEYEKALLNSKTLEHNEQEFLRELREEHDRLSQGDNAQPAVVRFYHQLIAKFKTHLENNRHPITQPDQGTTSTGPSTQPGKSKKARKKARRRELGIALQLREKRRAERKPYDTRASRRRLAASSAESDHDAAATETTKQCQSPTPQTSQTQSPAEEEEEADSGSEPKSNSGERDLLKNLIEQLGKEQQLSHELRSSAVTADMDSAPKQEDPWYIGKNAFKLMRRRSELDRDLVQEAARQHVTGELWKPRQELLDRQAAIQKREGRFLKSATEEHQKAALRLASKPSVQTIGNEFRIRRVLETFRAHLGLRYQPDPIETTRTQKIDPYEFVSSPAQPVRKNSRKRKAMEASGSPSKKPKVTNTCNNHAQDVESIDEADQEPHVSPAADSQERTCSLRDHIEAGELEERRQQLLQIVEPFLDDSYIVYDASPPTGRAARRGRRVTEEEANLPRLMSGALCPQAVLKAGGPLALPTSSKKQRDRARAKSPAQDESDAHHSEDEPISSPVAMDKSGSVRRSKRLAESHGTKTKGINAKTRSSSRPRSTRRAQTSPPESAPEESPTQNTLKARRLSTTTRTPSLPPPRWRAGSVGRDEATRIIGPKPPKMEDIVFRSPGSLFKSEAQHVVRESGDPFTDLVSRKKDQKRGARASSEWLGISTTPIPLPVLPYKFSSPAVKRKFMSKPISTREQLGSSPARFLRAGTEPPRSDGPQHRAGLMGTKHTGFDTPSTRSSLSSTPSSRSLLQPLPGNLRDDRTALEEEKRRWRSMLDL